MEITNPLYVTDRAAWRAWLAENHRTAKEVWLVYPRKATGRERIPYNDAVEEALCFGWIDSTQKKLDDDHTAQRFTPRRPGVPYSQPNQERMRRMLAQGKVMDEVRERLDGALDEPFVIPPDILDALRANEQAWRNVQRWSDSYLRIRVAFIEAKRDDPAEFQKRLANFIEKSERGTQYGVGIDSYY